ncbi:Isochorismatase hydrolase [Propionibacterium freudenreichii]|nr:Isochorismatase hydrolase [Propionibacterium freudenreichii]
MAKLDPEPIRDPQADQLLTPQNSVVVLIDFQPGQYATVGSVSREEIDLGVVTLAKLAHTYDIPTVVSTVAVGMGVNAPTVPQIMNELPGVDQIDRTGVNAWEDPEFRAAIEATGRRKIIMAGLWTEVCLAFPALDMIEAGYEIYPRGRRRGRCQPGDQRPRLRPDDPGRRAPDHRPGPRLRTDAQLGAPRHRRLPPHLQLVLRPAAQPWPARRQDPALGRTLIRPTPAPLS